MWNLLAEREISVLSSFIIYSTSNLILVIFYICYHSNLIDSVGMFVFLKWCSLCTRPGVTWCRVLQSKRPSLGRYVGTITVNPRFEQTKIVVIRKTFSWKSVDREKLLHWNLHLTNEIQREWGSFATICVAWHVLTVNVRTSGTKECSLFEHSPCE